MSLIDDKWEILFDKYNIENDIKSKGLFYITADQIREVKEPRLMTKFDTRESLPSVFRKKISILPVTRGKYVLGEFELYQDIPDKTSDIKQLTSAKIPDYYETIDISDIRSEANAINIMSIAGILDDFLGEEDMVQTVSGRMSSGNFGFYIHDFKRTKKNDKPYIIVNNSQVEIDGGFENLNIFSIIEGKNVVYSDFLIRQLYYPTRLWEAKISKPIRPVFMVYSNSIFRLLEYEFTEIDYYNSIKLVQERNYSLEDTEITLDDLYATWKNTIIKPEPEVTFIQADSFNKVISLVENLNESPMLTAEIAELFGFRERQADYYYNACRYLGLAEKKTNEEGVKVYITGLGKRLLRMKYKERQLEYVRLILEHQIFYDLFEIVLKTGELPDKRYIKGKMRELDVCGERLIDRRSSSVRGWLNWIITLVK